MAGDVVKNLFLVLKKESPESIVWTDTKTMVVRVHEPSGYGKNGVKYNLYFKNPVGLLDSIPIDEQTVMRKVLDNGKDSDSKKEVRSKSGAQKESTSSNGRIRLFARLRNRIKRGR